MSVHDLQLEELQVIAPGATAMHESGVTYVYMPELRLPRGCDPCTVEGLLRPGPGPDGYTTRLFLSAPFRHKGQNWTEHRILDQVWYTFSFNGVPSDLRLIEILANHRNVLT